MAAYAAYRHVELDNVGYGKKRVLKPPGGGSSDIFGADGHGSSPRRVKNHQQSQLGSGLFGSSGLSVAPAQQQQQQQHQQQHQHHRPTGQQSNGGGSGPDAAPRSKPGNDSYKRLFGPPDAPPPSTPNSKNHMRSNVMPLSPVTPASTEPSSPARTASSSGGSASSVRGDLGSSSSDHLLANGNGYQHNDVVAFRRIKRFRGSSCMPRNPVTGDGVDIKPHGSRRIVRRCRDGNPVTGAGYDSLLGSPSQQNGNNAHVSGAASSAGSDKSSTDSSPSVNSGAPRMKNRVPPGGFSSGLW